MPRAPLRAAGGCLLVLTLTGCASPAGRYGTEARYAPAYRSYVLAAYQGSDDPDSGEPALVLVDPLTRRKLRCEAEVRRWIHVHEDVAADLVHDDNVALASGIVSLAGVTAVGAALPVTLGLAAPAAQAMTVGGLLAMDTGALIALAASSRDGASLYADGRTLFVRQRYQQASLVLERAVTKEPALSLHELALYELGVAYAKTGREDDARAALGAFVDHAMIRDAKAYRSAEGWLSYLGADLPDCASQEPVALRW